LIREFSASLLEHGRVHPVTAGVVSEAGEQRAQPAGDLDAELGALTLRPMTDWLFANLPTQVRVLWKRDLRLTSTPAPVTSLPPSS
jgi:hypothetical protein